MISQLRQDLNNSHRYLIHLRWNINLQFEQSTKPCDSAKTFYHKLPLGLREHLVTGIVAFHEPETPGPGFS